MVLKCFCSHEYQDKIYGKNKRVFNKCFKDGKFTGYKCTVCDRKIEEN